MLPATFVDLLASSFHQWQRTQHRKSHGSYVGHFGSLYHIFTRNDGYLPTFNASCHRNASWLGPLLGKRLWPAMEYQMIRNLSPNTPHWRMQVTSKAIDDTLSILPTSCHAGILPHGPIGSIECFACMRALSCPRVEHSSCWGPKGSEIGAQLPSFIL